MSLFKKLFKKKVPTPTPKKKDNSIEDFLNYQRNSPELQRELKEMERELSQDDINLFFK